MRRDDREIKDFDRIIEVIDRCDTCRLALNEDGYPYVIPLNFGYTVDNGEITLYFHSASEGHKLDLIRKDNRASFEMDCSHELQYFADKGYCTFAYESVIGRGLIDFAEGDDKVYALRQIMKKYHGSEDAYFNPAAIERTTVFHLKVQSLTCKKKNRK